MRKKGYLKYYNYAICVLALLCGYIAYSKVITTSGEIASNADNIARSVVKVVCEVDGGQSQGTGFFVTENIIVTASHVIDGAATEKDIHIIYSNGQHSAVKYACLNKYKDLAALKIESRSGKEHLKISKAKELKIGNQLTTWGYPYGYHGQIPLLSVGHLAGLDETISEGRKIKRWVVNAAFNSGNSGGPLVDVNSGEVVGVVVSKVSPMPQEIQYYLEFLNNEKVITYPCIDPETGKEGSISNSQIIARVFNHLQNQTQLVIGQATLLGHLTTFIERSHSYFKDKEKQHEGIMTLPIQ